MGSGPESVDLAEKIAAGDDAAAEAELVKRFGPSVYALLCARTRDREACQDLLQDVFVAVLSAVRRGELRDHARLPAFVAGVARHIAVTHLRELVRQKRARPTSFEFSVPEGELAVERGERRVKLAKALDHMNLLDREILTRALQGDKMASVARVLGMTPQAVRQRKHRALLRIAEFIRSGETRAGG